MHLTYESLKGELTPIQEEHLIDCEQCSQRKAILRTLRESSEQIDFDDVPKYGWKRLADTLEEKTNQRKNVKRRYYIFSLLVVTSMTIFFQSNQESKDMQLQEAIAQSQILEGRIRNHGQTNKISVINSELWQLDDLLLVETDLNKRISLWKKRNELLLKLLNSNRSKSIVFI